MSALDGNAIAGRLSAIFSFEPTYGIATCAHCGQRAQMATWVVYVDAPGAVARCSTCGTVQVRIVEDGKGRSWFDLSGVERIELSG